MSIYGGPTPHKSQCKLKLTSQVVNAVSLAPHKYHRWSEFSITFDQTDNPDSIPKPGMFSLIVDPPVGMTRLTKALMDGSSDFNLMNLNTFEVLGLARDQLQSSPHPLYGVVLGNQSIFLGWITLL
jgi:hypothetical protein